MRERKNWIFYNVLLGWGGRGKKNLIFRRKFPEILEESRKKEKKCQVFFVFREGGTGGQTVLSVIQ